jgi:nitrite reductase/ring-hydroxylating ferredoxin subunit
MSQRFPFSGIPTGWYMVGTSDELPPGAVVTRKYFGTELVLYRTERGVFRASDPFCPHLGAHLGQGSVCGEELKCAFHGFTFDTEGTCTSTPYPGGRPPRKANLRLYPTREHNGMLLAFYDALGREPTWEVPNLDTQDSPKFRWNSFELNSHPQETSENSVDIGHFAILHDFMEPQADGGLELDGPVLRSKYSVKRRLDFLGMRDRGISASFNVFVHGLGYSLVEASIPTVGASLKFLIMSTPIHESRIHLRVGATNSTYRVPGITQLAQRIALHFLTLEVASDVPIWEAKRYEAKPALAQGDGEIAVYRRWAEQFYPPADGSAGKVALPVAS